ncbi:LytTR family DNA-binding domain-containing protein [Clostridium sp. CF012]|uniref:LytR/AlgR family response regulator transcription factor n=1 Tax=Clostridium sp. CF012 TaxID=2843319 RepID=UPI001C0CD5D2|nr:LytTR family DNA-binding domain-containing protein [Clostridium sp. CF012]MBU3143202.1 LytTR family DNA-binding domain-containing protein [Clostridium sp. CF012]
MEFKVLIGDDEEGMRMILRKAIEKVEGFKLIGEAADGEAVLTFVEESRPQVVFLDVEMPKLNGIECAKRIIDVNPKTIIVFATAHATYMTDAFQLYAFDYLVKPFKLDRVYQTLNRIKTLNGEENKEVMHKIIRYENGLNKILIKNKEGISFVDTKDIVIIQREDRNTVIYTVDNSYITSEALSELEERLDKNQFFRSHKSYIINLSMIYKIYPYGRWTYVIKLKNTDKDALLTHVRYEVLKDIFSL